MHNDISAHLQIQILGIGFILYAHLPPSLACNAYVNGSCSSLHFILLSHLRLKWRASGLERCWEIRIYFRPWSNIECLRFNSISSSGHGKKSRSVLRSEGLTRFSFPLSHPTTRTGIRTVLSYRHHGKLMSPYSPRSPAPVCIRTHFICELPSREESEDIKKIYAISIFILSWLGRQL